MRRPMVAVLLGQGPRAVAGGAPPSAPVSPALRSPPSCASFEAEIGIARMAGISKREGQNFALSRCAVLCDPSRRRGQDSGLVSSRYRLTISLARRCPERPKIRSTPATHHLLRD
uniref:Putative secreted protein n=1 Tax=Anopheles darlingi TaxID=43151 RepID=A0A2M4DAB8_ANODA